MIKVALLGCKSGAIAAKNGSFVSWISLCFVRKPHNILCMSMLSEKRSKLKNFTPKISSCVQLIVLSVRNTNIVMQTNRQTGIFGALSRILNYNRRGKLRRLWRLAVATQPPIAEHQSAPCPEGTRIYQKPTASSEGAQLWDKHHLTLSWFRKAGPTIILNIIGDASVPLRGTHFCNFLKIICKIIVKIIQIP